MVSWICWCRAAVAELGLRPDLSEVHRWTAEGMGMAVAQHFGQGTAAGDNGILGLFV